ncbi:MAG: AAA family ATPase, partial [Firmicutes bacterium]|nr:AAA family ATPase [Bacillota bacterium]
MVEHSLVEYDGLFKKIIAVEDYLNKLFIEREALISMLLLTVFSGQNMFILGKPGVAKSEIVYQTSLLFKDVKIFRYLLTKYTTPEEIFGSISLEELKKDRFYRKITNKLADVEIGFLDEIFKGNSSILNSLLMIANEKIYINDTEVVEAPLISLFGASNEIPDEEEMEELQALYDRFTIKYIAEPIKEYKNFTIFMLQDNRTMNMDGRMLIDKHEISTVREAAARITLDQNILNIIYKVREYCNENNYYVSDRKFKNMLGILK